MTPEERFEAKIVYEPMSGCWLWAGADKGDGYGDFCLKRPKQVRAHRFSWEITNGPIPDGLHVCHKCDTPMCVNPAHLFLGTHLENQKDKTQKGRQHRPTGSLHPMSKLTESDILRIRGDKRAARVVAQDFNVSVSNIYLIKRGDRWGHVSDGESG